MSLNDLVIRLARQEIAATLKCPTKRMTRDKKYTSSHVVHNDYVCTKRWEDHSYVTVSTMFTTSQLIRANVEIHAAKLYKKSADFTDLIDQWQATRKLSLTTACNTFCLIQYKQLYTEIDSILKKMNCSKKLVVASQFSKANN